MQPWCCSSLMTVCQRLARAQSQRLSNFDSMASSHVSDRISTCTGNICLAASATSKQVNSRQFHSQHADRLVSQVLSTQRARLQQQCHVNTSVSQSQSLNAPFRLVANSTQHATQNAAISVVKLQATTSQKLWRQSDASLASKHSGQTSLVSKAIEQCLRTILSCACTLLHSHCTSGHRDLLHVLCHASLVSRDKSQSGCVFGQCSQLCHCYTCCIWHVLTSSHNVLEDVGYHC